MCGGRRTIGDPRGVRNPRHHFFVPAGSSETSGSPRTRAPARVQFSSDSLPRSPVCPSRGTSRPRPSEGVGGSFTYSLPSDGMGARPPPRRYPGAMKVSDQRVGSILCLHACRQPGHPQRQPDTPPPGSHPLPHGRRILGTPQHEPDTPPRCSHRSSSVPYRNCAHHRRPAARGTPGSGRSWRNGSSPRTLRGMQAGSATPWPLLHVHRAWRRRPSPGTPSPSCHGSWDRSRKPNTEGVRDVDLRPRWGV